MGLPTKDGLAPPLGPGRSTHEPRQKHVADPVSVRVHCGQGVRPTNNGPANGTPTATSLYPARVSYAPVGQLQQHQHAKDHDGAAPIVEVEVAIPKEVPGPKPRQRGEHPDADAQADAAAGQMQGGARGARGFEEQPPQPPDKRQGQAVVACRSAQGGGLPDSGRARDVGGAETETVQQPGEGLLVHFCLRLPKTAAIVHQLGGQQCLQRGLPNREHRGQQLHDAPRRGPARRLALGPCGDGLGGAAREAPQAGEDVGGPGTCQPLAGDRRRGRREGGAAERAAARPQALGAAGVQEVSARGPRAAFHQQSRNWGSAERVQADATHFQLLALVQ
mmetsp:Transcript_154890/g.496312  ORF Transcript_154890/g.496312 Transcript_154890/m.496312 type:complete len:334 (+) Transcript_154890:128-1129(+)